MGIYKRWLSCIHVCQHLWLMSTPFLTNTIGLCMLCSRPAYYYVCMCMIVMISCLAPLPCNHFHRKTDVISLAGAKYKKCETFLQFLWTLQKSQKEGGRMLFLQRQQKHQGKNSPVTHRVAEL